LDYEKLQALFSAPSMKLPRVSGTARETFPFSRIPAFQGRPILLAQRDAVKKLSHRSLAVALSIPQSHALQKQQHSVIEDIRSRNRSLTIIELGKGHFAVSINERLLIDPSAPSRCTSPITGLSGGLRDGPYGACCGPRGVHRRPRPSRSRLRSGSWPRR